MLLVRVIAEQPNEQDRDWVRAPDNLVFSEFRGFEDRNSGAENYPAKLERFMTKVIYEVVEHDGAWAYRVDGVFSETFSTHDAARKAAERAAMEQVTPGSSTSILYEDKDGHWHAEQASGDDRPDTDVRG